MLFTARISEKQVAKDITSRLQQSVMKIGDELNRISDVDELGSEIDGFELYAYDRNGRPIYWSDEQYVPIFAEIHQADSLGYLNNDNGIFLIQQKSLGDSELVGMVTIRRNYKLSNQYLEETYNGNLIPGNVIVSSDEGALPIILGDKKVFDILVLGATNYDQHSYQMLGIFGALFLFGCLASFYIWLRGVMNRRSLRLSIYLMFGIFLIVRVIMIIFDVPYAIVDFDLFDPRVFHFGLYFSSLGDAILNSLCILTVLVFVSRSGNLTLTTWIRELSPSIRFATRFVLAFLACMSLSLFFETIILLIDHSQINLDISRSLEFDNVRVWAFFLLFLLGAIFFFVHSLVFGAYRELSLKEFISFQAAASILAIVIFWRLDYLWLVAIINLGYSIIIFYYDMPESVTQLKFGSVNYLIISSVALAVLFSFGIYKQAERFDLIKKQKFSTRLLIDRDFEGEYRLWQISQQMRGDVTINSHLMSYRTRPEQLSKWIQRTYLNTYFNDYDISITLFDNEGTSISEASLGEDFFELEERYASPIYETEYQNIFYNRRLDDGDRKEYICLVAMERYGNLTGFMKIQLQLKRFSSRRVLPLLLMDRGQSSLRDFDYAIYSNGSVLFQSGDLNYTTEFDINLFDNLKFYETGMERDGYHHYGVKSGSRNVVISSSVYPWMHQLSNFSFFFILVIGFSSLGFFFNFLSSKTDKHPLNFSTKILLFSGFSFIIPLLMVAIAVMGTTDRSYRKEIDKSNIKRTLLIRENITPSYLDFYEGRINKEQIESDISELANYGGVDLNIYNQSGKLVGSSTPQIFDNKVMSEFLNRTVFDALTKKGLESLTIDETAGKLNFKTSYVTLIHPRTDEVIGVIASPYFGSKNHHKRQQLEVFGNIINIFTFIFIVSIGIAFLVIRRLTEPITVIASKLHDTGFADANQPIEWTTDDEIGTLVSEYNNMLSKLDKSRQELARSEKEAAWREMAKQVAHEIKNPLTPMKLTIQHLQRILDDRKGDKKSLDILLSQIDTLDEIVTSFSHFAKMPTPIKEPFDIRKVFEKSVDLHVDQNITKDIEQGEFIVHGDKKLFGRIFNNLILNASHASKSSEQVQIFASLKKDRGSVLIEIRDNGAGIPEDIRDKVFVPNFSTKESGSGIGLAVAKRGIEHAGGNIWFDSEVGKGTSFFIRLDLAS